MTPPDILNDRRLELVRRIQTTFPAPTETPAANERIARLVQLRSEILPLFGASGLVTTEQVRDFGTAQRELLDLTYQDLQRLTQPFYIGIHEFFDYLKYHP